MADPSIYVDPPRRRARKGGILAVANVVPAPRLMAAHHLDWLDDSCDFPVDAPGLCWGAPVVGDKATNGIDVGQSGQVFGLYSGVECWLNTEADYDTRARLSLEAGEDRAIEAKLYEILLALDPTPSSAVGWVNTIAGAEEIADLNYVGQPVIVMSRFGAVQAAAEDALDFDSDGNLWTANGTPVLATGAVPPGVERTFYITGDLTLFRSDIVTTRATHPTTNREMAISERAYALAIDCDFVQAFTATEEVAP